MVSELAAADLVVLGLSVRERNARQFRALGMTTEGHWRDDVQYTAHFFQKIKQQPHAIPLEDDFLDVPQILATRGVQATQKILEKKLFEEIFVNTQGWIARAINKKISFFLTRFLVKTPWTPNQITAVNFFLGAWGCVLLISPHWTTRVFGAFLIQMNSILDGCDGEVARLKVLGSKLGAWLDTIADDVLNNLMLLCLVWGVFAQTQNPLILRFGLATACASMGVSFFIYRYLLKHNTQNAAHFRLSWESADTGTGNKTWFDFVKPVLKRDFFIFISFVLIAFDQRMILIALFLPIWGAFFLYLASYFYERQRHVH